MILYDSKNFEEALTEFEKAVELDQNNILARFKRATANVALKRYLKALEELEELKEIAGKEPLIYSVMGQIFRKLKQPEKAISCYTTALDLDSKNSTYIKSVIDKITSSSNTSTGNTIESDIEDEHNDFS